MKFGRSMQTILKNILKPKVKLHVGITVIARTARWRARRSVQCFNRSQFGIVLIDLCQVSWEKYYVVANGLGVKLGGAG